MNIRKLAAPVAVLGTALAVIGATSGTAQARLASGTVNRAGNLTVRWVATRSAALSAVFAGDGQYQARTVTTAVTVRS